MHIKDKKLIQALHGQRHDIPPVWMMRQAGRYLPEYRATRAQAGDFLSLCYNSDLATEVTLQPIRRYGFDASILFADILLVPQALGADLWFVTGEGPRLSTITSQTDMDQLKQATDIHDTLAPIYQTIRNLRAELPKETTLIGFAGAPWTVATYMIAGQGSKDQQASRRLMFENPAVFDALMDLITDATAEYLLKQVEAGAEVIKLFDSWASALPGSMFEKYCIEPAQKILAKLRAAHPDLPVIGFPRGAGGNYLRYAQETNVQGLALDTSVDPKWAAEHLQPHVCVQGNLDPLLLVIGGEALTNAVKEMKQAYANGPYIFNLGHGITPDADPKNVDVMLEALRG